MIETIRYPSDEGSLYNQFRYPGGEVQVRLIPEECQKLSDAKAVHITATIKDGEIVALAQLTNAIRGVTQSPISLLIPYLPYARADRRFLDGDCFGLQTFAGLINSLEYKEVVTLDAHSEQARIIDRLVDVGPEPLIETVLDNLPGGSVIILPDAGAKRYKFANTLQCSKVRDAATGKLSDFSVPSDYEISRYDSALIVDDICDGGRTFVGIAEKLYKNIDLYLYVSHGIFSNGFKDLNKYFKEIYTTDSLQPVLKKNLNVICCEGLMRSKIINTKELWNTRK